MKRQNVYDNPPPISDELDVQLNRAYLWHVTWNAFMNKKDACEKSGCSILRLNNAINAGGPGNVSQPGGQTLLTENVIVAVLKKLTKGAMNIDAVPSEMGHPNGLLSIIMKEIQLQQSNPLAIPKSPDKKTYDAWATIILSRGDCSLRSAELKAKGHKKPFLNLRNNVAFAAVMRCLFTHRNVHPELLLSTDDVSILVHQSMSDMKPVVIAPKVALKWLAENGIGVSVSAEELYKQRMITFKITISRTYPVAIVIIVYDRTFVDDKDRPAIYDMGDHIYVALAHPGIDQQVLEQYIEQVAIEPQEKALR
jgi:hypothetical protein